MQIEMHTLIKNILDKGYCQRPVSTLRSSISEQRPREGMLLTPLPFKQRHGTPAHATAASDPLPSLPHQQTSRVTAAAHVLPRARSKPQSAAPLLEGGNLHPGRSTSQLHSAVISSSAGRVMRCTKVLRK